MGRGRQGHPSLRNVIVEGYHASSCAEEMLSESKDLDFIEHENAIDMWIPKTRKLRSLKKSFEIIFTNFLN
jgi:hypothetical protein